METQLLRGLTGREAENLQKKYGPNELVRKKVPNPFKKFLSVFKEPMFLLLIGVSALYLILGQHRDAFIMLVFVAFVASITFIQEWKTEKTMDALKNLTSPKTNVLRDGKKVWIKSSELVPGDIIFISEGERIPADCEVLKTSNFCVDESTLTGESEPVFKVSLAENEDLDNYWRKDRLYAGTLTIFGKCTAKVSSIGTSTEYGKIGKAISEAKDKAAPLQKKTQSLVKVIILAGIVFCILVTTLSYLYTGSLLQGILSGMTLAMAIIPEEFPVVLTVFLSMGAYRLAKQNTLMRRISAVETLGSTTVLCVDKTGTITQNSMKVKAALEGNCQLKSGQYPGYNLARLMIMSCERDPYDPMEKAIIEYAKLSPVSGKDIPEARLKIPFDPRTRCMANIFSCDDGFYVAAKGSPETIISLCSINEIQKKAILKVIDSMSSKGLRVLAFADAHSSSLNENLKQYRLNFKGIVGLCDPPKEGVREAIQTCLKAGMRVVMITGDYSRTAMAIGREVGLKYRDCTITGEEIDSMTDDELCHVVAHCDIFSRVIPEHKMRIIKALQKNGDIVAMTGDGVNDASALKSANIGIAMGKRGTEVAREAADMILMDDNFTTIVKSIRDGRRIYDNIRKAMVYIMIIHIPIAAMALCAPLFNLPQILLPVHIVLLELIIDPTCSIIFEGEEEEPNIMDVPPRSPEEPILTKKLSVKVILQGLAMFILPFTSFHFMVDKGFDVGYARSFALVTLITANVIMVLVNRSNTQYLFHIFKEGRNTARLLINSLALLMVILIVYIPVFQTVFSTNGLGIGALIEAMLLGAMSTFWWEGVKLYSNIKALRDVPAEDVCNRCAPTKEELKV